MDLLSCPRVREIASRGSRSRVPIDYGAVVGTYERLADLPLEVESYELEGLEKEVSSEFTRLSTVIHLRGGGHEGVGEDVTYDALDHVALQDAGPVQPLAGPWTLDGFANRLAELDLFPSPPVRDVSRLYRRWGFESAALDLALRQTGLSLADALGREARPVVFVVSLRLGSPASLDPVRRRLERYPSLRFKLDPTSDWDDGLVEQLVATEAVDSLDFKGHYRGTVVDQPPDPDLYRRVIDAFPDAWLEDPALTDETRPLFDGREDRITWDAPIHSIADIEALPFPPEMVNVKPSRLGSLRELLDCYDYLAEREIGGYGGGQFELGPGRGHIQYLAAIFHPDTPNDVAPGGYNEPTPRPGLPDSPLPPSASAIGFRWGEGDG
jgi:L-alanine-DL-glutamate epimerase-like enolase superfamily enzyme